MRKHGPVKQGCGKLNTVKTGKAESTRSLTFLPPRETVKVLGALQLNEVEDRFLCKNHRKSAWEEHRAPRSGAQDGWDKERLPCQR